MTRASRPSSSSLPSFLHSVTAAFATALIIALLVAFQPASLAVSSSSLVGAASPFHLSSPHYDSIMRTTITKTIQTTLITIPNTAKRRKSGLANKLPAFLFYSGSKTKTPTSLPFSFTTKYFHGHTRWRNRELPWSPICETMPTTTAATTVIQSKESRPRGSLTQMTMAHDNSQSRNRHPHDTEGFRDAIRGGQGYIAPRDIGHAAIPRGKKTQEEHFLQSPNFKRETNNTSKTESDDKNSNIGSGITTEATIQQQTRRMGEMKERQLARTAKLHVLANRGTEVNMGLPHTSQSGRIKEKLAAISAVSGETIVDNQAANYKINGSSDSADAQHCLENFRDGRESAQYVKVKGGTGVGAIADRNSGDLHAEKRFLGVSAELEGKDNMNDELNWSTLDTDLITKENSERSFEDSGVRMAIEVDIRGDFYDGDSSTKVDRLDMIRGPLSENFRDGARMATYKEKEFSKIYSAFNPEVSSLEIGYKEGENDTSMNQLSSVPRRAEKMDNLSSSNAASTEKGKSQSDRLVDGGEIIRNNTFDYNIGENIAFHKDTIKSSSPSQKQHLVEKENSVGNHLPVSELEEPSRLLSIDPNSIKIIPLDVAKEEERPSIEDMSSYHDDSVLSPLNASYGQRNMSMELLTSSSKWQEQTSGSFVKMFRGSASYIANHRGTLAVYHIPGELLAWDGFPGLMDDIALTWLLGMRIVLVAGCRHQIEIRLHDEGNEEPALAGKVMMSSVRVTDEEMLRVVKEEAGFVRFEIERRLAKSLRLHGGLVKGSESLIGNVVSGNFYSAQPFGVLDGVDYCWTGFPRKVEIERIRQVHETNDIVLLTSLGVSPSGEIFNVNSEFLAATVAGALSASKIVYFNVHGTSFQNKISKKPVQNLRVSDAKNLLAHYKMRIHPKGFALIDLDENSPHQSGLQAPGTIETLIKVGFSMVALEKGVNRAHILAPENGALVQELYTRDGCGTLISRDIYEGIRRADVNDVSGIYDLIDPLVRSGTLVERPKSQLEKEILSYYVYTRDGLVVATGQLKRFEGGFAEIGCLVVSKEYRRGGRGDAMIGYLERLALHSGATKVFVLSTQTMEWFIERGYKEVPVESLPPSRQALYNTKRKSKIYMKEIGGDRDLDAAELWWSNR